MISIHRTAKTIWAIKIIRIAGAISSKQNCLRCKSLQRGGVHQAGQRQLPPAPLSDGGRVRPHRRLPDQPRQRQRQRSGLHLRRRHDHFLLIGSGTSQSPSCLISAAYLKDPLTILRRRRASSLQVSEKTVLLILKIGKAVFNICSPALVLPHTECASVRPGSPGEAAHPYGASGCLSHHPQNRHCPIFLLHFGRSAVQFR